MLNFVLCDDNLVILHKLEQMLTKLFMKNDYAAQIGFKSDNVNDVLAYIKSHKVNVLFLDINLQSNISGIDLAAQIRRIDKEIYIIFTTAHLEYALVAYKVKTFDYIAKPITMERLQETLDRLFVDLYNTPKKYLTLNNKNIINQNDIQYIKKDGMKLIVCTPNKKYETYSSFSKIQNCLPDNFVRCHKSYIANINNITNIEANTNTIRFENSKCYIGPKYKNNFMEVLNNYGNFTNTNKSTHNT